MRLDFCDIAFLRQASLITNPDERKRFTIARRVDEWADEQGVTIGYMGRMKETYRVGKALERLAYAGWINPDTFIVTDSGREFLKQLGEDWRRWFLEATINDDGSVTNVKYYTT
jgi:hypothetical protein